MAPNELTQVLKELRQVIREELRAPAKRLLTVEEAAAYLGIASKTLRNCLGPKAEKPFPVRPVKIGGRVLFKREALDAFIDGLGAE